MFKREILKLKFDEKINAVHLENKHNEINIIPINESEKIIKNFLNCLGDNTAKKKVIDRTSKSFWQQNSG